MTDSFCAPCFNPKTGKTVTGGAARNIRIANLGGMDNIIATTVSITTEQLLQKANTPKNTEKTS